MFPPADGPQSRAGSLQALYVRAAASCIPAGVPCNSEVPAAFPAPPLIKYRLKLAVKAALPGSSTEICLRDAAASAPQLGARGAGGTPSSAGFQWAASLPGPRHRPAPLAPMLPCVASLEVQPLRRHPRGFPHCFHPARLRSGRSSWRGARLLLGSQERILGVFLPVPWGSCYF